MKNGQRKKRTETPRNKFTLNCITVCCDYKTRHGFYKTLMQSLFLITIKQKRNKERAEEKNLCWQAIGLYC